MKTISLCIVALCALCVSAHFELPGNGDIDSLPRIVGGKPASKGQFPYQVSLRRRGSHYCGGSIVNRRFVLTAGHCISDIVNYPSSMKVAVGLLNRFEHVIEYDLEKITLHPLYSIGLFRGDIALLRTEKEIEFTEFVQPIALPTQDTGADVTSITSGWGQTRYPGSSANMATILQYLELNTIDLQTCIAKMLPSAKDKVRDYHLCTTSVVSTGPCFGDSGGPLMDESDAHGQRVLVGIVSWGIGCAQGYPHVFTRVYSHIQWLNEEMEKQVPGILN